MNIMNKPVSRLNSRNGIAPNKKFHRSRVLRALEDLGYSADFSTNAITVLRNTDFPFARITLPNSELISFELIKLYAADNGFDAENLYNRMINF